jgi:hypothetical protein
MAALVRVMGAILVSGCNRGSMLVFLKGKAKENPAGGWSFGK